MSAVVEPFSRLVRRWAARAEMGSAGMAEMVVSVVSITKTDGECVVRLLVRRTGHACLATGRIGMFGHVLTLAVLLSDGSWQPRVDV